MEFCKKLQELRKQKGLTQEELAESLYVSRTAISKWESGRGYPNIDSIKEISTFFNITIASTTSFFSRQTYLFTNIRSWNYSFCQTYVVIF